MLKKILFLLLPIISFSQNVILSDNAEVSILTCGTAPVSYAMYGHTGIRITDYVNQIDVVYNYGAFDFTTPNFMMKFVKGDLKYFVTNENYYDFEYNYKLDGRSIVSQELNLTSAQKQQLLNELNTSLTSDERFYTYKFIDKNCTTMVVDKINKILGNEILKQALTNAKAAGINPSIYTHPIGFHGHAAGTTIGMWDFQNGVPGSGDYTMKANTCYSIELNATHTLAGWDKPVKVALEQNGYFSGSQFNYMDGRQTKIHAIQPK
jgi:hypothetical protein